MSLKERLRADLTAAMKARDTLTVGTLRMALAAVTNAEVAGDVAKELTDAEVQHVLTKEVRKRKESAEVFAANDRQELADKEDGERAVLEVYLPSQLTDDELQALVTDAVTEVSSGLEGPIGMRQMGQVIKLAQVKADGRADGGRISTAVKAALQS